MIEELSLRNLLKQYNFSDQEIKNIISTNDKLLTLGEYHEIDATLSYLINELKVAKENIIKCPSIMYFETANIKENVAFLQEKNLHFSSLATCLHVLSTNPKQLQDTFDYVSRNYGVEVINKTTSILNVPLSKILAIEALHIPVKNKNDLISIASGRNNIKEILEIITSPFYKLYPELFTANVLAQSNIKTISSIINSSEFKTHPELFTSSVLTHSSLETVRSIIQSEEFKTHPELFTSGVLARSTIEKISDIIRSPEFRDYPWLFTSHVLSKSSIEKVQALINSTEFQNYPQLFTSEVLSNTNLERLQEIINSPAFKEYPELFTSTVLAYSSKEKIEAILESPEFQTHPKLFSSEVLARSSIETIKEIIQSPEFQTHPELFTSQVLAHSNQYDIERLLKLPYWQDARYTKLLTSSLVAKSKSMLKKLPQLFEMAEDYHLTPHLTTTFLLMSPSQNYALINYLNDHNIPLIIDNRLNPVFGKQPGLLKKKYNIDLKKIMEQYPLSNYLDKKVKKI